MQKDITRTAKHYRKALQAVRKDLAAQLADIDARLAVLDGPQARTVPRKPRKYTRRKATTRPKKTGRVARPTRASQPAANVLAMSPAQEPTTGVDASARRVTLLDLIRKAEVGLTAGELKAKSKAMTGVERSNALSQLKIQGKIRRVGNTWVCVPPSGEVAGSRITPPSSITGRLN